MRLTLSLFLTLLGISCLHRTEAVVNIAEAAVVDRVGTVVSSVNIDVDGVSFTG